MSKTRKPHDLLTTDAVRKLLAYDPETGVLTWKPRPESTRHERAWNTKYAGRQAGSLSTRGYLHVRILGRDYRAHRVIWLIVTGDWPGQGLDHADGDPSNNRFDNLRPASQTENRANSRRPKNNTTSFKGVTLDRRDGRYLATIGVNSQKHYLGHFDCPEKAHQAYLAAAEKHFGEFARAA